MRGPLLVGYDKGYTIVGHTVRIEYNLSDWSDVHEAAGGHALGTVDGRWLFTGLPDARVEAVCRLLRERLIPHTVFPEFRWEAP